MNDKQPLPARCPKCGATMLIETKSLERSHLNCINPDGTYSAANPLKADVEKTVSCNNCGLERTMGSWLYNWIEAKEKLGEIPLYLREFPDFGIIDVAIPDWLEDRSWHNNLCPSFESKALGIILWVDYADPDKKEFPEWPHFAVSEIDANGEMVEGDFLFSTENWDEMAAFLEEWKKKKESEDINHADD